MDDMRIFGVVEVVWGWKVT